MIEAIRAIDRKADAIRVKYATLNAWVDAPCPFDEVDPVSEGLAFPIVEDIDTKSDDPHAALLKALGL